MNNYALLSKRLNLLKNTIKTIKKNFKFTTKQKLNFVLTKNYDNQKEIKTLFNEKLFEVEIFDRKNEKILTRQLPFIWLRDSCKCNQCFDHKNEEQSYNLTSSSISIRPLAIESLSSETFSVRWTDDHESIYNLKELSNYVFENELKSNIMEYWDKKTLARKYGGLRKIDYHQYLVDDDKLKSALEALVKFGVVIIENIPLNIEYSQKALERISFIQETIFGKITILKANFASQDSAYSNVSLKAHNDNTYFKNAAGLEAFQLIQHDGQGGNTLLVDAFNCAQILKASHPREYDFLSQTYIKGTYMDRKQSHQCSYSAPIIQENKTNDSLYQIRYNPYNRCIPNHLTYDDILRYYEAIKKFGQIIEDESNELWIRLEPGQMLIFDNYRILHGRSAFTGNRELLTAYLPRDEWRSKARAFDLI